MVISQVYDLTLPSHHAEAMQRTCIVTFRNLLDNRHGLDRRCPGCRRWASTDLAGLVAAGLEDRPIGANRPRCRKCGSLGEWKVRPPMPQIADTERQQSYNGLIKSAAKLPPVGC